MDFIKDLLPINFYEAVKNTYSNQTMTAKEKTDKLQSFMEINRFVTEKLDIEKKVKEFSDTFNTENN